MELCCDEVGGRCAFVARVIDAIAANGESGAMRFVFWGAKVADDVAVGGSFMSLNLCVWESVGTVWLASSVTLSVTSSLSESMMRVGPGAGDWGDVVTSVGSVGTAQGSHM